MSARGILLAASLLLVTGQGACRRDTVWPPSPAAVTYGEDACTTCRMILADEGFGGQLQDRSGQVAPFDDLGCLRAYVTNRPFELVGVFARSFDGHAWIRGDAAWVVESHELASPMAYGVAAFADEAAARREAARHAGATVRTLARYLSSPSLAASSSSPLHSMSLPGGP